MNFISILFTVISCHLLYNIQVSVSLKHGGQYRIRSMHDGLYATAGNKRYHENIGMDLGNVTCEKWGNFREQRWDLIGLDQKRYEYWIFSQENTFNKMSAVIKKDGPDRHVMELIPTGIDKYAIRSTINELCLENPGYGVVVVFAQCKFGTRDAVVQEWEFDLLTDQ